MRALTEQYPQVVQTFIVQMARQVTPILRTDELNPSRRRSSSVLSGVHLVVHQGAISCRAHPATLRFAEARRSTPTDHRDSPRQPGRQALGPRASRVPGSSQGLPFPTCMGAKRRRGSGSLEEPSPSRRSALGRRWRGLTPRWPRSLRLGSASRFPPYAQVIRGCKAHPLLTPALSGKNESEGVVLARSSGCAWRSAGCFAAFAYLARPGPPVLLMPPGATAAAERTRVPVAPQATPD
jgi:hypothetical protein